ncbi:uncharacterized protein LOC107001110 [Solanum pennellii]|uniref:Uncharacterized protein LOC107001110 n=1 Tax=Solanum pennellii TaxID=28526 RepID=A0ABM1FC89_SOLPN|nr:uncharacterized protein LOC107001110 [Solanum pennellii]
MTRFVTGVADLVKEECRTAILLGDMNLYRLMVYAQSIEESKLNRISKNLKIIDQGEGGSSSQGVKTICVTCGKKNFGKCLFRNGNCFGCGKDGHKVRDCDNDSYRGGEAKQDPPSAPEGGAPKRNHIYAMRARGSKPDDEDDVDKL